MREIQKSQLSRIRIRFYAPTSHNDKMKGIDSIYNGITKHKQTRIYAIHHIYMLLLFGLSFFSSHPGSLVVEEINSTNNWIKDPHIEYAASSASLAPNV